MNEQVQWPGVMLIIVIVIIFQILVSMWIFI